MSNLLPRIEFGLQALVRRQRICPFCAGREHRVVARKLGVVRIRYIDVRPHVLRPLAGARIGFRVVADARRIDWRFAGRTGVSRPGLLVLRARRAGRFRLVVSVGGHTAQALVIVRPRG